jgi:hypothetical protein
LGHGPGINQGHDRDAETGGNVGRRWLSVEEAHDAFDQDQVRFRGRTG